MLIPIPIGIKYTLTVGGSLPKLVRCEQCGLEYVYTVERAAAVQATSYFGMDDNAVKARAVRDAAYFLNLVLEQASDPVPCPGCGFYQKAMVDRLRQSHLEWMYQLGIGCILVFLLLLFLAIVVTLAVLSEMGGVVGIAALILWSMTVVMFAVALTLFLLRRQRVQRYSPNDEDATVRIQHGQRLALPKEQYEQMVRQLGKEGIR